MNEHCNRPTHRQAGFTLIEIMVVIVIIGLLATLVIPNLVSQSDEAKITKAKADITTIKQQADYFRIKNNKIPTLEDLITPDEKGHAYIENLAKDPWGNEYEIRPTERGRFEVVSFGPDGSDGTNDDITSNMPQQNG